MAAVVILVLILLSPPAMLGYSFLLPGKDWDPAATETDDTLLFQAHHEFHPNHYDTDEKLAMFKEISLITMTTDPQHIGSFPGFFKIKNMNPVGSLAPDFELPTTDGRRLRLSEQRGKINAFMFVAMTCPPARRQVPHWERLYGKYDPEEVNIFMIYSRERHPGEPGFREFTHTTTDEEKRANARLLARLTGVPVAVDSIEEDTLAAYGKVPNAAFVIDRGGHIVFKSTWADADKVETVIDRLLEFSARYDAAASRTE